MAGSEAGSTLLQGLMEPTEGRGFGPLLRAHRVAAGLSQEDLAERAQLSRRTITNLERGVSAPYRQTVALLVEALQLTESDRAELESAVRRARTPLVVTKRPAKASQLLAVSSRLAPPRLSHALVERQRLLELVDGALSTPLTLVSAGAGWGKTTLLAAWARRHEAQLAWLSLHELDSSPTRFWLAVITALRCCGAYAPDLGETAVVLLQSPQPAPLSTWLSTLIRELESQEVDVTPVVLIVDDYQLISDPAIHEGMSEFLERLPTHLHVILSSREDPPLPLARWRARGQLTEIRTADLRFSLEEAGRFLGAMLPPSLSEGDVGLLVNRTEGWIAGLHLAALALRQREDRTAFLQAFSGSQRYLLDYVQEDILARLPANARDFLVQTAILSSLDASVCQIVMTETTEVACQQMLVALERANLFLVPLDEERRSYRLHDLFREALLAALRSTQPEMVPVLHRRAAGFYEARGQWAEAIVHWLAAEEFSLAARLMEQTAEEYWLRGEAATMVHWVMALPQPVIREHAHLVLTTALYLLNTVTSTTSEQRTKVRQPAQQLIARVESALLPPPVETGDQPATVRRDERSPSDPCTSEDALLHRRLRLLRMLRVQQDAADRGDFEPVRRMEHEIEEALAQDDEPLWQMVPLALSFSLHYTVRCEGACVLPRLLDAKAQVSQTDSRFATIKIQQWLANSALDAGRLRLVYRESLEALDLIEQMAGYALLRGYFELYLSYVFYHWNRLEEAQDRLHKVLHVAEAWQHFDLLEESYEGLLRVALARRDWQLAHQALQDVERLIQGEQLGYLDYLRTLRARWELACGQLPAATAWAASVVFPEEPWDWFAYETFPVVMRVYFAQQRWQEAADLLERWRGHVDRPIESVYTIIFLAQSLVALYHTGKSDQARETAARLFALTKPEGYLRVYLDEGEPMRQALKALLSSPARYEWPDPCTPAYVSILLSAFGQQEQDTKGSVMAASDRARNATRPGGTETVGQHVLEPLTEREREVLRLLAVGQSNPEIARTLYLEVNTVKTHLKRLYGKLGVHSRVQAVRRAQELSIL